MTLRRELSKLGALFRRRKPVDDLAEEIRAHLEMEEQENLESGMPPDEAHYAALRRFGNVTLAQERSKEMWRWNAVETLWQDLRFGLRTLYKDSGFTVVAMITLALGIGATTALFTVVRSVLLRPLPFKDPARLVRLYEHSPDDKFPYNSVAGGVFAEWRKQSHGFSDLAIVSTDARYNLSGAGGQLAEKVSAAECSWNTFPTLGVEPALGRNFTAEDDRPSAAPSVILSWGLWKRRFGGDPSILNQTIHLDAKSYTVLGVMPAWFAYPDQSTQLWTPIYHEAPAEEMQAPDSHDFVAIGRLKSGMSETEATAELSVIVRRMHDQHLDDPFISNSANSRPLLEDVVGDIKTPLYILLAATGCLLLIACLNVTSLLVARGVARRREFAIRAALGGSRWRLLAGHLTESFLLSAAGAAAGLMLAYAMIQWFVATRPDMSRVEAIHMDGMVVAFVLGLILACAIFAGATSSLSIRGNPALSSIRDSSRSHSAGTARVRLRQCLLSLEVGLAVVLLIAAGLLLKSYARLRSVDLGCATQNVLTLHLGLPETKYSQAAQGVNFFDALLERVRSLPGIQGAGVVRVVPGEGYGGDSGFAIAEHPPLPLGKMAYAIVRWADPGYFAALGIPLLRGQTFDDNRRPEKTHEAIISQAFVRQYFPGEDPIGKHLVTIGRQSFTIVGVVGDTRFHVANPVQPIMYFPIVPLYGGKVPNYATLAVRSSFDVTSLALPIQRVVQELDPELAVSDILTMDQVIGKSTLEHRFEATLLVAFAVLSLALAAVGLFGVLSYIVAQRTQEIGIRVALGAQKSDVLRLVVGQGMMPASIGMGLGIIAALGITRLLSSLLYGVKPTDPLTFASVLLILAGVAALATYLPARRAAKVDPMVALRYE
ncbi:MAG: ABC transporter permease [Terriglobia bacterium]|jgi:putative ABC transport system permease protein